MKSLNTQVSLVIRELQLRAAPGSVKGLPVLWKTQHLGCPCHMSEKLINIIIYDIQKMVLKVKDREVAVQSDDVLAKLQDRAQVPHREKVLIGCSVPQPLQ